MRRLFASVFALALGACTVGGDDAGGGSPAPDASTGIDGAAGTGGAEAGADADQGDPPAVEGTWAQELVYAAINDIPAVGQTNGTTTTIQRTTVQRQGTTLTMLVEPCTIEVDNGTTVVQTIIPDAFIESLGITDRSGELVFEDGQWRYVQSSSLQLRGVKLDNPATDPLPEEPTDPQVWDQDEDGNPGVTVRIAGITDGEVYVVQRDTHALDGVVSGADRIDGLADWATEQVVLGSDNPILDMQTQSTKDPDEQASLFRSTRIDGALDCAGILAQRDTLFAR